MEHKKHESKSKERCRKALDISIEQAHRETVKLEQEE